MDLPINDDELSTIVNAMTMGGNTALYQKLKLVKELREQGLPYKKFFVNNTEWWLDGLS